VNDDEYEICISVLIEMMTRGEDSSFIHRTPFWLSRMKSRRKR